MPTWKDLVSKIETEEQYRAFANSLREAVENEEKRIAAEKKKQIMADYDLHPEKYLDSKGQPYSRDRMESEKADSMIADRSPEEFFDEDTQRQLNELSSVLITTGSLKNALDETHPAFKPFTNGKVNEYGKQILDDYIVNKFVEVEHPHMTEFLDNQKNRLRDQINQMTPPMNDKDVEVFMNLMANSTDLMPYHAEMTGFPDRIVNEIVGQFPSNTIKDDPNDEGVKIVNSEYDKSCKQLASDFLQATNQIKENLVFDPEHPSASTFRAELIEFNAIEAQALKDGLHLNDDDVSTVGFREIATLIPQLNVRGIMERNADDLENVLKEYPIDKLMKHCNEMQKKQNDFKKNFLNLSDQEKEDHEKWMRGKTFEIQELSEQLYEKSLNPTPATLSLFGKPEYLTGRNTGFIGNRGLTGAIDTINQEFKPDIPEAKINELGAAIDQFNTSRSFIFRKESDKHKDLRLTALQVKENLEKLKEGTYTDKAGVKRPMGLEEKERLINETMDQLNTMSMQADTYINDVTKNNSTPNTPAGKARLSGARSMKDMISGFQDMLMEEQVKDQNVSKFKFMDKETKKEAKQNQRKSLNLKDLQKLDEAEAPKRERRNSVHEPDKRPKIESASKKEQGAVKAK